MKIKILIASAALALAACGPAAEAPKQDAAPAAPADMLSQVQAQAPEMQPVFAWQQLVAYQTAHPDVQPPCPRIRRAESRGIIPTDIEPTSIYAPYVGQLVFSIQCGEQLTTVRNNPAEHWLVLFAPGASAPTVINCAEGNTDRCAMHELPRVGSQQPAP